MTTQIMASFVVYGAGGIGGVLGARLHEAGHEVVLVARGAHREVIERAGLRVECPTGTTTVRIPVSESPGGLRLGPDDIVLLTMKSQDTEAALRELRVSASVETHVVCVQNGVENERAALRRFANVYGVCVMFPTTFLEPGVVTAHSSPVEGILDVGRCPSGVDDVVGVVSAAFGSAT